MFQEKKAAVQVAIGAVMVSFSAVFVKLSSVQPTMDAFYRMLFGGMILLIIALLRKEAFWIDKKAFFIAILAGILFAFDLSLWHRSILFIGPGLATIIINLQVFVLTFIGYLIYKEKLSLKFLFALPLALLGMYLLVGYNWTSYGKEFHLGVTLALIATCFYTSYIFAIRRSQTLEYKYKPVMNLAISSLAAAATAAIIALFQGEHFSISVPLDWIWLIMYGIFGQVLGWLLISMGLPKIKLSLAGFLLLLQPALAFIWGITIFREVPALVEIIGAIVTLVAIYLSSTAKA